MGAIFFLYRDVTENIKVSQKGIVGIRYFTSKTAGL